MLTKRDLKWTTKFFSVYSQLMWIPVTFRSEMLGVGAGEMRTSSILRRIGFKVVQILFTCHTFFMSCRTLDYMSGGGSSGSDVDGNLDWDMVPMMIILAGAYVIVEVIGYLIFDSGRELNTIVYNEYLKLRGKEFLKMFQWNR